SGDIGTLDSRGLLTFVDRMKDLIISGGLNISAAEVERVLDTCRRQLHHGCGRDLRRPGGTAFQGRAWPRSRQRLAGCCRRDRCRSERDPQPVLRRRGRLTRHRQFFARDGDEDRGGGGGHARRQDHMAGIPWRQAGG
ncbi:MAG: hypothetical protein EOO27_23420, partial [Comamonadaceae bacterium]